MWHFRRHPRHRKGKEPIAVPRPSAAVPTTAGPVGTDVLIDVSDAATRPVVPRGGEPLVEVTRLRAVAVLRPAAHGGLTAAALREAADRVAPEVKVVVVDLSAIPSLEIPEVRAVSTASRAVTRRGQEMLIVNLDEASATALRRAGVDERAGIVSGPFGQAPAEA